MLSRLLAHADAFRWQPGVTPLSSIFVVLAAPPLYVGGVFALRAGLSALRGPRPLPLGPLPAVHNAVLLLWSATMFAGCAQAAAAHTAAVGSPAWLLCTPPGTAPAGRLFFWSYVYYVSKFYELLDTVLRVLKAQPLTLLHVFHHAAVLVMAHFWLRAAQSLQVLGLLANTGVHVLMYGYYLACSCGARPGRAVKQAVTGAQIVQFLFSLAASVPFLWLHSTRPGGCSGFDAWAANVAFNVLLLGLFADFHRKAYGGGRRAAKRVE